MLRTKEIPMKKTRLLPVLLILTGLLCAGNAFKASATADARVPVPATGPANTASRVVQKFLDARLAGNAQAAYALLTDASKKEMPPTAEERQKAIKSVDDPGSSPPIVQALAAMFLDFKNVMDYNIRLLGPSAGNPHIVLVRAYKVGTPLSKAQILKIATTDDPASGGSPRIDFEAMILAMRNDPSMARRRSDAMHIASESNLKQIALAIIMYTQDHSEKLPDADKWVDEIMPYVKTEAVFHDPAAPAGQRWSYAYNKNLSGVKFASLANPAQTVLAFDSTLGTKNARDTGASVPKPGLHAGASDFAFADGHVQSLPDTAKPSFALSGASPTP
jgi:prepilin-type processing-associated H-X9-DG protein